MGFMHFHLNLDNNPYIRRLMVPEGDVQEQLTCSILFLSKATLFEIMIFRFEKAPWSQPKTDLVPMDGLVSVAMLPF